MRTSEDAERVLSSLITTTRAQLQRQLRRTSTPARGALQQSRLGVHEVISVHSWDPVRIFFQWDRPAYDPHTRKLYKIVITEFSTVSRFQQNFVAPCWQPT
ncbi:hypothetical protein ABVT39_023757 [Epinephelus coioides]